MIIVHQIPAQQTDVAYRVNSDIDVNASKDIRVKIVKVIYKIKYHSFQWLRIIPYIAGLTSSGCSSNPCSVGICYQLNKNGPSYVCICPDGTLNLSCSSASKISFSILLIM